ncbi:MAG: AAA-like domain protein [Chloroflexi bacterium ADurb.Bin344]|nr:MAG: AAA-like domain protein [Chloroflexi bacterium ADurb.Bin344]
MTPAENIGFVIGGSLKEGLFVRLTVPAERIQEGAFVVIESNGLKFYGLVVNLSLKSYDPRYSQDLIAGRMSDKITTLLHNQTLFTEMEVLPVLMQNTGPELGDPNYDPNAVMDKSPMPVKTLPIHQAPVRLATEFDVSEVFKPKEKNGFVIGTTREQGHPVHIDMDKFIQRSSGIFGATGTGKSYLTRMILAGLIQSKQAAVLVFDMHNEYAYGDISPDTDIKAPGLCEKMKKRVKSCALGASAKIAGNQPDFDLVLEYSDILPSDIEMLTRELNLRETTPATLSALVQSFGINKWFESFKNLTMGEGEGSVVDWARNNNVNEAAALSLYSKLERVFRLNYLVPKLTGPSSIVKIIDYLKNGYSVILSFGEYETDLDYLLVTNILTRKIREEWERMTNEYRNQGGVKPTPLVIALEEAHKLLNREMAGQTTFSTIAREMRKYFVTLLIIDQRPSQIYDEVMSQLGTRISGWLGDDEDIAAVLSGLSGRDSLRGMLARLQPKEEVLLLGYGVPMPIPIRSRRYDAQFWQEMLNEDELSATDKQKFREMIFDDF